MTLLIPNKCLYTIDTTQDGQIDAEELQRCLTTSGISGSYQR